MLALGLECFKRSRTQKIECAPTNWLLTALGEMSTLAPRRSKKAKRLMLQASNKLAATTQCDTHRRYGINTQAVDQSMQT